MARGGDTWYVVCNYWPGISNLTYIAVQDLKLNVLIFFIFHLSWKRARKIQGKCVSARKSLQN